MNNSNPEYNESLMRYLDREMSDSERENFEKQLATDSALQEELQNLLIAREAIRAYGLTKQVAEIHQTMMNELKPAAAPVKKINKTFRYAAAVAVTILLAFILYEAYNFFRLSPQHLYSQIYSAYELPTARAGSTTESPLEKAYREKKYTDVINIYKTDSTPEPKELFLTALAYLETNDPQMAVNLFQLTIEKNKPGGANVLNDQAEYYLVLAYLQNEDYDEAINLMIKIRNEQRHLYKGKFTAKYIRDVKLLKWK